MVAKRSLFSLTFLVGVLVLLDRISKSWALSYLTQGDITLAPGINFHLTLNRGVSFSLLWSDGPFGFALLTALLGCIVIALSFFTVVHWLRGATVAWGYACVLAGGISNVFDRLLYGGVVDFIDCYVGSWHFATFNLADAWIVGGVAFVMWRLIRD